MLLKTVATKQRKRSRIPAYLYRMPFPVTKVKVYCNGDSYPVCPRCDCTMDREYMKFCDRCGQHLAWGAFDFAGIIHAPCEQ